MKQIVILSIVFLLGFASTFQPVSAADQPNGCLVWLEYGQIVDESGSMLDESWTVAGFDIAPDGAIVIAGQQYLGRDRGQETLDDGTIIAWDVGNYVSGIFVIAAGQTEPTPIFTPDGWELQGFTYPSWSPDGTQIVFSAGQFGPGSGGDDELFIINADGSGLRQMTFNTVGDIDPDWGQDGIAFVTITTANYAVAVMNPVTGEFVVIREGALSPAWSPDGSLIAFDNYGDVGLMSPDGNNIVFVKDAENWSRFPSFTPAGELIFSSRLRGELISTGGSSRPSTYLEIYSVSTDGQLIVEMSKPQVDLAYAQWRCEAALDGSTTE